MSAIRALIEALGADYGQWRGLVRPLIKVSFRAPLNPGPVARRKRKARLVSGGTLFLAVFCGLIIANTAGQLADPFPFSLLALNLLAIFVLVLRLQNFQAVTVSPKDYEALGHRPVSPRTYLLARLAVLMANQGIITAIMAGPVVLLSGLRFGWPRSVGLLLAAGLLVLLVVLALISVYAGLIGKLGGRRLVRALTLVQLVLAGTYLAALLFQDRVLAELADLGPGPDGWLLAVPTVWFAALAALPAGEVTGNFWICLLGVAGSLGGLGWFARDRLSLSSARNLAEMPDKTAGGPPGPARQPGGFAALQRLNAAATLIRGQFRRDMQFRMGVVALLPIVGLALITSFQASAPLDPFVAEASAWRLFGVHFALLALPVYVLEQTYASESYRAGWIFFATPANRARFAGQARHCVVLFVLAPCLVLSAIVLAWLFEALWHALAHVFLLACLSMLVMQAGQLFWPRLPFTLPLNRRWARAPLTIQLFGAGALCVLFGPYAAFAYARPAWTIGTIAVAASGVLAMEWVLPAQLNRRLRWLESES